ncbi:hypothetical protein BGZ83_008668 [Gryganskiella cystojenkinii]|nr:hypothetical protein BGZ83_008668 [Gryganskiella cystojenkinii]
MCLAQRAMAAEHATAVAEERRLLRVDLEHDQQNLTRLRTTLNQRKETLKLSKARFEVAKMNGPPAIKRSISKTEERWASGHEKLGHSRRVLVAELVTLFDLKCVPERRRHSPTFDLDQSILSTSTALSGTTAVSGTSTTNNNKSSSGRSRSTKLRVRDYLEEDSWNEYLIVGRPLPTGYFENYDRDEINTTIENVIHMMTLVACYLGIKLPYDTHTRQSQYYIQAAFTAGSKRAPLFLNEKNIDQFAAGLGYLNYNIAYLCHSQGVHITLANASNTLENLLACCQAPNLGRYTNYASIVATKKRHEEKGHDMSSSMDEATIRSPASEDGDFETIGRDFRSDTSNSKGAVDRNESLLWCPGHEPFDLNVDQLIAVIQSRREEESPVWGGLQLQDAVAANNLENLEDDYILNDDQEEEDGMYTLKTPMTTPSFTSSKHDRRSSVGSTGSTLGNSYTSLDSKSVSAGGRNRLHLERRPPHPSRERRQSDSRFDSLENDDTSGSSPPVAQQGQPENWTFLDVDIFRVPSSVNSGPSLLSGRGWPDMSVLRSIGSAVGGAAVGLVNGAAAQSPRLGYRSRIRGIGIPSSSIPGNPSADQNYSSNGSYPTISSSAP